ncbi:hypothetical protein ABD440_24210, partial [Chromobacterium piscinae]
TVQVKFAEDAQYQAVSTTPQSVTVNYATAVISGRPTLSNVRPRVGDIVTADLSQVSVTNQANAGTDGTWAYQWFRNTSWTTDGATEIPRATNASYQLTSEDGAKFVFVRTYPNRDGVAVKESFAYKEADDWVAFERKEVADLIKDNVSTKLYFELKYSQYNKCRNSMGGLTTFSVLDREQVFYDHARELIKKTYGNENVDISFETYMEWKNRWGEVVEHATKGEGKGHNFGVGNWYGCWDDETVHITLKVIVKDSHGSDKFDLFSSNARLNGTAYLTLN